MAAIGTTRIANKPAAAAVAVPLSTVIVYVAEQCGLVVPATVAAAFSSLLIAAAYVLFPSGESSG